MNAPFDPEETRDGSGPGADSEPEDPFGENSATWGAADPDFDEMLRARVGPLPSMPTPPYAFERVLLTGRRRRARKVWAAGAAAAVVVMAGTAGTTVALSGLPSGRPGVSAAGPAQSTTPAPAPSPSVFASPSASASAAASSPSASASKQTPTQTPSSSAPVPQCHSDDLQLTVAYKAGSGSGGSATLLIVLRNDSGHSCTTTGYPGLQTETAGEQLQTTSTNRVEHAMAKKLTLAQGQTASTVATFTTVASGATPAAGAGCGAPSAYLDVIPPNEENQILAPISGGPITVCASGVFTIPPLVMGSTGGS
jgi:hypothetical protein